MVVVLYSALPCPALPCPALPCPALPCPALLYKCFRFVGYRCQERWSYDVHDDKKETNENHREYNEDGQHTVQVFARCTESLRQYSDYVITN